MRGLVAKKGMRYYVVFKTARGKRLIVLDAVTLSALRARQAAERLARGASYDDRPHQWPRRVLTLT